MALIVLLNPQFPWKPASSQSPSLADQAKKVMRPTLLPTVHEEPHGSPSPTSSTAQNSMSPKPKTVAQAK